MSSDSTVRFVIQLHVHDVPGFKTAVGRCVRISRDEPGTLIYDWYLNEETGEARLYEAYDSLDALDDHVHGPVFGDVGPDLIKTCEFRHVDAFGDFGDMVDQPTLWPTTYWGRPFDAI